MRLIFLGPPGCGKGTQARLLCERNALQHISTGDLLREAKSKGTPVGLKAKSYLAAGSLVPDEVVNDIIAERFRRADRPENFVMDGYPRTVPQSRAFDALVAEQKLTLDAVILFAGVTDEEIVRRITGRWNCPLPGCNATYHIDSNPPRKPGICDICQTPLVQRSDDKKETVLRRLEQYHQETEPVIPYYREQGLLREVGGIGNIEEIYEKLMRVLSTQAGRAC